MRRAILLFVKYPEPGRVKTRLAAAIGAQEAATAYRKLAAEVCRQLPDAGETVIVQFDPPERRADVEQWLSDLLPPGRHYQFSSQCAGDLGQRLEHAFAAAFETGFDQVAVIGSDCIELSPEIFEETWCKLSQNDVVLGPSSDGGYYLLAMRALVPTLFHNISWSTEKVLAQTWARAGQLGLRVSLLRELNDVDTEDDWHRVEARLKA